MADRDEHPDGPVAGDREPQAFDFGHPTARRPHGPGHDRRKPVANVVASALCASCMVALPGAAVAASDAELADRIAELERIVADQSEALAQYKDILDAHKRRLDQSTLTIDELIQERAAGAPAAPPSLTAPPSIAVPVQAQAPAAGEEPIGVGPSEDETIRRLEAIPTLYEVGGVLTPKGQFVFEPSLEYSHAAVNRFTFRGIELQEVLLIGVIEASDADRNLVSANAGFRYGVTDRLELEARVPYLYRDDKLTFLIPELDGLTRTNQLEGYGLGDIEVAAHYQLNRGVGGWPVLVGNARFKTITGTGPFDVDRDSAGVEQELATGSGFYEVEPSITAIFPTDPAVLFANVGYSYRMEEDVNEQIGDFFVKTVDPGDSINVSFGMGFAINDNFSFSLGYKHNVVLKTETTLINELQETSTQESERLHIGSATFGMSYLLSDRVRLNLDMDWGITEDAPDMRVIFRMPIKLGKIF